MIFKTQVRWMSEKFLRNTLRDHPSHVDKLLSDQLWPRLIDGIYDRCYQLNNQEAFKNVYDLEDYVKNEVVYYVNYKTRQGTGSGPNNVA